MSLEFELLERYDANVPRYTSYPTAPHFHDGVNGDSYRRLLSSVPAKEPVSLYFHVPFCAQMCWYCGCHTQVAARYEPISDYAKLLANEIEMVSKELPGRLRVGHLHWGGGTPTMLSAGDFQGLMDLIHSRFEIDDGTEIAVEIDPRTATMEKIEALGEAGVNRASLGIQDFDPEVQTAINRLQPYDLTTSVVERLRGAGIHAINFDLMYGLPKQTVARVEQSIEQASTLSPDRIALFGYAHVPWMKTHQKMIDESELPDGEERLNQSHAAADALTLAGFRRVGLDHFAHEQDPLVKALDSGRLHRNFQGYTTDISRTLLGFGASSIGYLAGTYVQNAVPFRSYETAIREQHLAVARGVQLSTDDHLRRDLIERLMCDLEVDVAETCRRYDTDPVTLAPEIEALAPLITDGLVRLEGSRVAVTEYGRPLVRSVCAQFDAYLGSSDARHSRPV